MGLATSRLARKRPRSRNGRRTHHYPKLKMDGGHLDPWNVRLAHVYCNNMDYGWRKRIRRMLEKDPTLSFKAIAEALNRKKKTIARPGAKLWTARLVRKAYVS